jgi:hypothetical protein
MMASMPSLLLCAVCPVTHAVKSEADSGWDEDGWDTDDEVEEVNAFDDAIKIIDGGW